MDSGCHAERYGEVVSGFRDLWHNEMKMVAKYENIPCPK
jgi:hypothetical protein